MTEVSACLTHTCHPWKVGKVCGKRRAEGRVCDEDAHSVASYILDPYVESYRPYTAVRSS